MIHKGYNWENSSEVPSYKSVHYCWFDWFVFTSRVWLQMGCVATLNDINLVLSFGGLQNFLWRGEGPSLIRTQKAPESSNDVTVSWSEAQYGYMRWGMRPQTLVWGLQVRARLPWCHGLPFLLWDCTRGRGEQSRGHQHYNIRILYNIINYHFLRLPETYKHRVALLTFWQEIVSQPSPRVPGAKSHPRPCYPAQAGVGHIWVLTMLTQAWQSLSDKTQIS